MRDKVPSPYREGSTVIEILIALSMAAVLFFTIGNVFSFIHSVNALSTQKAHATALARQTIEIVTSIQNNAFGCSCTTDDCASTPGTCKRTIDNQQCLLQSSQTQCWTQFPKNLNALTPLHTALENGSWVLAAGQESTTIDVTYTTTLTIENAQRDANGALVQLGGMADPNSKQIAAVVSWTSKGASKSISLTTLLTAWKND